MKRESKFQEYIQLRTPLFLLFFLTLGTFGLVYFLYHIPEREAFFYAALLVLFFWLCYVAADFLGFCRRREERKRLEELLAERKRQLARWEEREKEMGDYYLMWAHQIKTPIAAMKLLAEERDDGLQMSQELFLVEQYAEMVLHYLRLESMSSDLLLQEYSLEEMVCRTVRKFSVFFIGKGLELELGDLAGVRVVTDEKWLCFVLEQLLSNSVKYTKKGKIAIFLEKERTFELVIEDTGIGIRPEDLPRIFERGFTGYNGRMDQKSTGIGLYLVRQVLENLNIPIRVESAPGKGTRVFLDLFRVIVQSDKNVSLRREM